MKVETRLFRWQKEPSNGAEMWEMGACWGVDMLKAHDTLERNYLYETHPYVQQWICTNNIFNITLAKMASSTGKF